MGQTQVEMVNGLIMEPTSLSVLVLRPYFGLEVSLTATFTEGN